MLPNPTNTQPQSSPDLMEERNKRNRGTGFTNIGKMLGANVGAGSRMGGAIGSQLGAKAGEIRKGIEQGKSQFAAGKQTGSAEAESAITTASGLADKSFQNQEEFAGLDPNQLAEQGRKLREAEYKGPFGLEEAGKLQSKSATAAALAKLAGTSGGQRQLLSSMVAQRGGYGRGLSEFDRMLLAREGQKQVQSGRGQLAGIESETERAVTGAEQEATAKQKGIESQRVKEIQDIRNKLYGEGTAEQGGTTGLLTQAKSQANVFANEANRMKELLTGSDAGGKIGTPENPLKPGDEELFNKIQTLGVGLPEQIYADDPALLQRTLSNVAGLITPDVGGYLFKDKQREAASNLGALLQGVDKSQEISRLAQARTEFKPTDTTYKEQKDIKSTQDFYRDVISKKDSDKVGFGQGAAKILGEQRLHDIAMKVAKEESGIFGTGSSQQYINNRIRNIIEDEIRAKLRNQQSTMDVLKGRLGIK